MKAYLRSNYGIVILLSAFGLFTLPMLNQMIVYTPDSARYMIWANSLAHFKGYVDYLCPEPTRYVVHGPLYSLLLVPSMWIAPLSVVAAKMTTILFGLLALWMFYTWIKRRTTIAGALITTLIVALNSMFIIFSTQVLSDVPFLAFVIVFFLLLEDIETLPSGHWKEYVLIGVMVCGALIRGIGLSLVLTALFFFVQKKQYKRGLLLLSAAVIIYAMWYVRNEILVAGIESPLMQYGKIYNNHYFTPTDSSFLRELVERYYANGRMYWESGSRMLFFPEYRSDGYGLVSIKQSYMHTCMSLVSSFHVPIFIVVSLIAAYGIWIDFRKRISLAPLVFFVVYLAAILTYPLNDPRLLFPLLLPQLYYIAVACNGLLVFVAQRHISYWLSQSAGICCIGVFLLPEILFNINILENHWHYSKDNTFFLAKSSPVTKPSAFLQPLNLTGAWIASHTPANTVLMARWKEIALWCEERRVFDIPPQITPDDFDLLVRDYHIQYLVSLGDQYEIGEFDPVMMTSRYFSFHLACQIGNTEIFQILPKSSFQLSGIKPSVVNASGKSPRLMFLQGLRLLSQGNGREAGSIFHSLATYAKQDNLMFPLYEAISYEMAEEEFEAEKIFYSPSLQTEAGTFLHILTYHKEIVEDLKKIHQTTDPHTRANLYSLIAIYYRQMGYTGAVDTMFRRSLAADPKFYPTLIFSAIYDWQDGKYDAARLYCKKAAASDSANPLTKKIQKILDEEDILQHAAPGERPALLIQQANDLINAGMREDAIDRLLLLLHEQSQDRDAQKMLADLYLVKQRYAPAEQLYRSLLAADPQNASIRHQLSLLEQRR